MSRTKEIDVWIHESAFNTAREVNNTVCKYQFVGSVKAKLIIELPERRVKISESQLRECFDTFRHLDDDHDRRLVYSFLEFTQQKLFKEQP